MQDKILHKAGEMFLTYGVKSVTMDDLAHELGISKKTIYEYYSNKETLVDETTNFVFDCVAKELKQYIEDNEDKNPVTILFDSYNIFKDQFKEEQAPEFQLKKYFPAVHDNIQRKKYELIINIIKRNLTNGIDQGYYRPDIDTEIVAKFYYNGLNGIRDDDIFPMDTYKPLQLMVIYTTYYIRAIATPKGIKTLEKYLTNNEY